MVEELTGEGAVVSGDEQTPKQRRAASRAAAAAAPQARRRREPPPKDDGPEDTTPVRIRLVHGSYVGLGCPDVQDRIKDADVGFGYTHDHPAYVKFEEREGSFDAATQTVTPTADVFVDGEVIQLYPIPEHEKEAAEQLRAKDKRFSFSRKEAEKRAAQMVRDGCAEHVS